MEAIKTFLDQIIGIVTQFVAFVKRMFGMLNIDDTTDDTTV